MSDRIAAPNAEIHWRDQRDHEGRWRVAEVEVFDREGSRPEREELTASAGACCADWMDGSDPRSTPEGVYAGWTQDGFLTPEVHLQALRELGRIDGVDWAITMADALYRRLLVERIIVEPEPAE